MRAGRLAASIIAASLAMTACRGDDVSGLSAACTDQPGCEAASATVSPQVIDALDDAGTRLTGSLSPASAATLASRLTQLARALTQHDLPAGRLALAATYDTVSEAERTTPGARPDLGAVRLALIPAARFLGVFPGATSSATQ